MTLEEAIKHCEAVASAKCDSCGAEHRQLANWLEELRLYREAYKKYKAVFDEMERRNEPEPYKCPDCIVFPCGRKECDKNHEAKACKYFELW